MQGELVPAHGIHPYPVHPWFSPLHAAGSKVPLTHYSPPHMLPSMFKHPAIDRTHDAVSSLPLFLPCHLLAPWK